MLYFWRVIDPKPANRSDETASQEPVAISVLIVSWNSKDYLYKCLQSLERQCLELSHLEVIVVDNHSMDGSAEMVEKYFPWVKLIRNNYNYGFAKATNQAYRQSRGRYVMTLNPDTDLPPGSLKAIVDFLDAHADAGAVQPWPTYFRFNYWPKLLSWQILIAKLFPPPPEKPPHQPKSVEWLWGTAITVRRDMLSSDKFYEEWSFLFCEEYDLCKSVIQRGYKMYILPIHIQHFAGGSRKVSQQVRYEVQKLSHAAIYIMNLRELGHLRAQFHSFVKFIDGLLLWSSQALYQVFKPNAARAGAIIEWKALWWANLHLLLQGRTYFTKMNTKIERTLNDNERLLSWLGQRTTEAKETKN